MIFHYHGNSMKGTFKKGDFPVLKPWAIENLHKGDIVAFKSLSKINNTEMIVHRITCIENGCIYTRGDNNKRPDMIPVSNADIKGKVIAYERDGRRRQVMGGMPGLIIARIKYIFRRGVYLFLTKMKLFTPIQKFGGILIKKFWKSPIQKIKISTKEGPVIKWVFQNRTIAQQIPGKGFQRSSILSYFLVETKNPDFPSDS